MFQKEIAEQKKREEYLKGLTLEELLDGISELCTAYCDYAWEICRRAGGNYEEYWLEMPVEDSEEDMQKLVMEAYHIVNARG